MDTNTNTEAEQNLAVITVAGQILHQKLSEEMAYVIIAAPTGRFFLPNEIITFGNIKEEGLRDMLAMLSEMAPVVAKPPE